MAMTLSQPHPERPLRAAGRDARRRAVRASPTLGASAGCSRSSASASSPGSPTSSRATPPTTCSREIDEVGVRDGATSSIEGYDFAPTFSIWTTIEECLNPPVIWETRPRLVHDRAVLRAGDVRLPGGHRRRSSASTSSTRRCCSSRGGSTAGASRSSTGSATSSSRCCARCTRLGLDSTKPVRGARRRGRAARRRRGGAARSRRRSATACAARTCAGTWVTGTRHRRRDRARCTCTTSPTTSGAMREYGHQAVVWQTAINPVVALELLAERRLERRGRARPRGVRRGAVPRPPAPTTASRHGSRTRPAVERSVSCLCRRRRRRCRRCRSWSG